MRDCCEGPSAAPATRAGALRGLDPVVTAEDLFMPRRLRTVSAAAKARSSHPRREALRQEECTSQRVQQIGLAARATPGRPTGASRLADFERRVRANFN